MYWFYRPTSKATPFHLHLYGGNEYILCIYVRIRGIARCFVVFGTMNGCIYLEFIARYGSYIHSSLDLVLVLEYIGVYRK